MEQHEITNEELEKDILLLRLKLQKNSLKGNIKMFKSANKIVDYKLSIDEQYNYLKKLNEDVQELMLIISDLKKVHEKMYNS